MNKQILSYLYLAVGLVNVVSWIFFEGAFNNFTKPLLMPILMLYLYERFNGAVVMETLLIFAALVFSWTAGVFQTARLNHADQAVTVTSPGDV